MVANIHSNAPSCVSGRPLLVAGLGLVLIVALLLRLVGYLNYPSMHHPDELFQYLEQAHRLVFGYGIIPWEYREGTRSWLLPGALAGLMKLTASLGFSSPDAYLGVVATALSMLSLSVVIVGFLWAYRTQGVLAAFVTTVLCSIWFELVYFAPKSLTEVVAAHLLVIAVYLAYPGQPVNGWRRLFIAGLLFGLIVSLRVHLAPALLVAAIYICRLEVKDKWVPLVAGGALVLLFAGLLDAVTWDYPFQSLLANLRVNILEKRSHFYGVESWSFYIKQWLNIWGLAVIPMALLSLLAMRRHVLLGLIAAAIVLTHMLFAHKEYRFVFPAVPFVIMLVGLGTAEVLEWFKGFIRRRWAAATALAGIIIAWASVSAVLAVSDAYRYNWHLRHDELQAARYLHDREDLCGVGLVGVHWLYSGGYTWLHRDVPVIIPLHDGDFLSFAYNYALASPGALPDDGVFVALQCSEGDQVCVYRRQGGCEVARGIEANEVLRLIKQ